MKVLCCRVRHICTDTLQLSSIPTLISLSTYDEGNALISVNYLATFRLFQQAEFYLQPGIGISPSLVGSGTTIFVDGHFVDVQECLYKHKAQITPNLESMSILG